MAEVVHHWQSWRGADDQLARIFKSAVENACCDREKPPTCRIDVEVKGDHEVFDSPKSFLDEVTTEALRRFKSIRCTVTGPGICIEFLMAWHGPYGVPARSPEVNVSVTGEDESRIKDAAVAVRAAVNRAGGGMWRYSLAARGVEHIVTTVFAVAAGYGLILLGRPHISNLELYAGLLGILFLSGYVQGLIFPALEIKVDGKSRLKVIRGTLTGIASAVLIAGLTKLIFG